MVDLPQCLESILFKWQPTETNRLELQCLVCCFSSENLIRLRTRFISVTGQHWGESVGYWFWLNRIQIRRTWKRIKSNRNRVEKVPVCISGDSILDLVGTGPCSGCDQARNQLGTPGETKRFLGGDQIF